MCFINFDNIYIYKNNHKVMLNLRGVDLRF